MRLLFVLSAIAVLVAEAVTCAPVAAANDVVPAASVGAERLPWRMDSSNQASWWKPLVVRGSYAYVAFNGYVPGPRHTVRIARQSLNSGSWRQACLRLPRERRCARYRDDIGHNQPTIAVDGRGYIHAFVSMHHDRWRYFRSKVPRWVKSMRFRAGELFPSRGRFTYPITATAPNGDVWMIARQSGVSSPDAPFGRLYRWSVAARRWRMVDVFAAAAGHGVYPDDLEVGADGRVHMLWSWSGGPAAGIKHAGSYMVYDPATGAYANAAGETVSTPATPASPVVFQPLEPGEEWAQGMAGFGQRGAVLALDPATGWPLIAYRYQSPADGSAEVIADGAKVRLARWTGAAWESQDIYDGATSAALGITVHDGEPRVYYDERVLYTGQPTLRVGVIDWPVAAGSLAVAQMGPVDYVYRAAPGERWLYLGRVEPAGG